jgi:dihydrofolate reductase
MDRKVSLILACMLDGGIGYENGLPWYIPKEMKKFQQITTVCKDPGKINAVIMARHTWESLGKPLKDRVNIVISRNLHYNIHCDNVVVLHSVEAALRYCDKPYIESIFITGGAFLYNKFLTSSIYFEKIDKLYLSIMFYDPRYIADRHIEIDSIFKNFILEKDKKYQEECEDRLFASFICKPKEKLVLCDNVLGM